MTTAWPPSITDTTELVVPKSIPMILLILLQSFRLDPCAFSLQPLSNFSVLLSSLEEPGKIAYFCSAIYPGLEEAAQGSIGHRFHCFLEIPACDLLAPIVFGVHAEASPKRVFTHLLAQQVKNPGSLVVRQPAAGVFGHGPGVKTK